MLLQKQFVGQLNFSFAQPKTNKKLQNMLYRSVSLNATFISNKWYMVSETASAAQNFRDDIIKTQHGRSSCQS